jgi:hypothetical protein
MAKSSVVGALEQASEGLLFPSETDAPFEAASHRGRWGPGRARPAVGCRLHGA